MNLLTIINKKDDWDYGLFLTYDINPINFFEVELLNRLKINNNLTIALDSYNYDRLMSGEEVPNYLGVYYNIEQIKIKNGGIFHPKLIILVSKDELFFAVGSMNLTDSCFKKNVELYTEKRFNINELTDDNIFIIGQIKSFLQNLFINNNTLIESISESLKLAINNILNTPFLQSIDNVNKSNQSLHFLSTTNSSLFSQTKAIINHRITKINVLSPFYNSDTELINDFNNKYDLKIFIPEKDNTFPKESFINNNLSIKKFNLNTINKTEFNYSRFIHAKLFQFITKKKEVWNLITSGNFTKAGFINDVSPRNCEVGVLYKSNSHKFIDKQFFELKKIQNIDQIECRTKTKNININDQKEVSLIFSALYKQGKIFLELNKNRIDDFNIQDYYVKLNLSNQPIAHQHNILQQDNILYIEPQLEIEGNVIIKLQLFENNKAIGYPIYVNREKHLPNYLPILGATTYHECIKIGGLLGIDRAFDYAMNSGKEEWLIYLLSHWDLEKIYLGLQDNENQDEDNGEDISENIIPSNLSGSEKLKKKLFRKNINTFLEMRNSFENLMIFCNSIQENEGEEQYINLVINYCIPFYLEITKHYMNILAREENKKLKNPDIEYPAYTWRHNYKAFDKYFNYIYQHLSKINLELKEENNFKFKIYSIIYLWFELFTNLFLSKNYENYPKLSSFQKRITKEIAQLDINRINSKVIDEIEKMYNNFDLKFEALMALIII